jgi:ABC-type Fe3+ transport system substrate-binding protein
VAQEGVLERFRPLGIETVPERYVDPDGFWSPLFVFAFVPMVDIGQIPLERAPREYRDFLRPELRDGIILTYPHDDDAVLYQFSQIIAAEGWDWLDRLLEQKPRWVRGTATPQFLIGQREGAATFASARALAPAEGSNLRLLVPSESFFQACYQVGGMLRGARHKAAGRLYLAHLLSPEYQNNSYQSPARRDAQVPAGNPPSKRSRTPRPTAFGTSCQTGRWWSACAASSSGSSAQSKESTRTRSTCDRPSGCSTSQNHPSDRAAGLRVANTRGCRLGDRPAVSATGPLSGLLGRPARRLAEHTAGRPGGRYDRD